MLHPYGSLLERPLPRRPARISQPALPAGGCRFDRARRPRRKSSSAKEAATARRQPLAAYREGNRWTQDVEHFHPEPAGDRLRERGAYLITGGLGGLGMAVADWLARSYRARLVLLSRHGEPKDAGATAISSRNGASSARKCWSSPPT